MLLSCNRIYPCEMVERLGFDNELKNSVGGAGEVYWPGLFRTLSLISPTRLTKSLTNRFFTSYKLTAFVVSFCNGSTPF